MFRKPKRKAKAGLRKKENEGDVEHLAASEEGSTTSELLDEARKRVKAVGSAEHKAPTTKTTVSSSAVMHSYETSKEDIDKRQRDLVTSSTQHHPDKEKKAGDESTTACGGGDDGIFRDKSVNAFHAGPIKVASHVRVTARFDYQPDVCKDYKQTGFCGFGDTCIYLHDRGDTLTGWQLEQQYEDRKREEKKKQEAEMNLFLEKQHAQGNGGTAVGVDVSVLPEDGIPFACYICREYFKNPVVTSCHHYFCEACIIDHVRSSTASTTAKPSSACPICSKDTNCVFNEPTKLLAKRRKVLGIVAAKAADAWEHYAKAFAK